MECLCSVKAGVPRAGPIIIIIIIIIIAVVVVIIIILLIIFVTLFKVVVQT